jgi:hypothetical protein
MKFIFLLLTFVKAIFLMSHDAATGYINTNRFTNVVYNWVITQKGNLTDQLNCGARAFDLRPTLDNNDLYFNHGPIEIKTPFKTAINDVISWHNKHQNETILLYISHCNGESCIKETIKQLNDLGIKSDCHIKPYAISGFINCIDENYDQTTTCYNGLKNCWSDDIQYKHLLTSLDSYASKTYNNLWLLQAHWQYTKSSIESGIVHLSSIIKDELNSQLNKKILSEIKNQRWKNISIIQLDNICDGGSDIYNYINKPLHYQPIHYQSLIPRKYFLYNIKS